MSRYFIIIENTLQVFELDGEFESLTDAYNQTDTDHYSHGESCIIVSEHLMERLAGNIRAQIRPSKPSSANNTAATPSEK